MPRIPILLTIALAAAAGDVPGLPLPPIAGVEPVAFWLDHHNDYFADAVRNLDDYRTGGGELGVRIPIRPIAPFSPVIGADYSSLTDRGGQRRADELTLTLGLAWDHADKGCRYRGVLAAGGGTRSTGNFGTDAVQNGIHSKIGNQDVTLTYERKADTDPLAWAQWRGSFTIGSLAPVAPGVFAIEPRAGFMATATGHLQSSLGSDFTARGRSGAVWLGGLWRDNQGPAMGLTAAAVDHHEQGWWIQAGMASSAIPIPGLCTALGLFLDVACNPATRATEGRLGLKFDVGSAPVIPDWALADRKPGDGSDRFDQDVFFSGGTGGHGAMIAWRPSTWHEPWGHGSREVGVYVEYRMGHVPGYGWDDNSIDYDQGLIGLRPGWRSVGWPVAVETMFDLGAGLRWERVNTTGPNPAHAGATSQRVVIQGGPRIRLGLGRFPDSWIDYLHAVRLGFGLRGYVPLSDDQTPDGGRYQRPGYGFDTTLGASLAW